MIDRTGLFLSVCLVIPAGNDIGAFQPAVQIDVAAARGAERAGGLGLRLAADRAGFEGACGLFHLVVHRVLSLHAVRESKSLSPRGFLRRTRRRPGPFPAGQFYYAWGCFRDFCKSGFSAQTAVALSQPKRIGKPSPPSSVVVS